MSSGASGPRADGLAGRDKGEGHGRLGGTFSEAGDEVMSEVSWAGATGTQLKMPEVYMGVTYSKNHL